MATILIVDDEKPVRQFLVTAFQQEGHLVLEAAHGRQALNILAITSAHPDIVISDVMMPLVGGVELCGILKSDPATADIPIVLMSSAHPRASTNSEADAIIGKPFDLDTLDAPRPASGREAYGASQLSRSEGPSMATIRHASA